MPSITRLRAASKRSPKSWADISVVMTAASFGCVYCAAASAARMRVYRGNTGFRNTARKKSKGSASGSVLIQGFLAPIGDVDKPSPLTGVSRSPLCYFRNDFAIQRASRGVCYFFLAGFLRPLPLEVMEKSSIFLPDLIAAASQRGFRPRPAQVSVGFSGFRYFAGTEPRRPPPDFLPR